MANRLSAAGGFTGTVGRASPEKGWTAMEYLFEVGAAIGKEAAQAILARRGLRCSAFDLAERHDEPLHVRTSVGTI